MLFHFHLWIITSRAQRNSSMFHNAAVGNVKHFWKDITIITSSLSLRATSAEDDRSMCMASVPSVRKIGVLSNETLRGLSQIDLCQPPFSRLHKTSRKIANHKQKTVLQLIVLWLFIRRCIMSWQLIYTWASGRKERIKINKLINLSLFTHFHDILNFSVDHKLDISEEFYTKNCMVIIKYLFDTTWRLVYLSCKLLL